MSLRDAKNFMERFKDEINQAQGQRQLQRKQGLDPVVYQDPTVQKEAKYNIDYSHSHSHRIEKDLPTEVFLHLQKGEKIQAIKALREQRGLSLNQANQMVQGFYRENPQYQTDKDVAKRNPLPFIVGLIIGFIFLRIIVD